MSDKYTTIQVSKEFLKVIKDFCNSTGRKLAPTTEIAWLYYISSSMKQEQ